MSDFVLPQTLPLWDLDGNSECLDTTNKVIGLYFSASWCPPCRTFTPLLNEKLKKLKDEGQDILTILVSADQDEESAKSYHKHSELPFMLDYSAETVKELIDSGLGIEKIPTLVFFNDGKVITMDGTEGIMKVSSIDELKSFGEIKAKAEAEKSAKLAALRANFDFASVFPVGSIVDNHGAAAATADLALNDVVLLYFSAHWCGPCRNFTPQLVKKFEELKAEGKRLECIFLSSDRSSNEASEYFSEMPWKMLKYEERDTKKMLSELFEVEGIPTLVLLTGAGKIITVDGREALMECEFDKLSDWAAEKAAKDAAKAAAMAEAKAFFDVSKVFEEGSLCGADGSEFSTSKLAANKLVFLYFFAADDEDCKEYNPKLLESYKKWKAAGHSFEFLGVSCDQSNDEANEASKAFPWPLVKWSNRDKFYFLAELQQLRFIPTLVAIKEGKLLPVASLDDDNINELMAPTTVFEAPK